jgi:hypothetical protein
VDYETAKSILEITSKTSKDEARQIYRELLQVWHPDKYANNAALQERATEKIKILNEAWYVYSNYVSDPEATNQYKTTREPANQNENVRSKRGVGGWLLVFIILALLSGVLYLINIFSGIENIDDNAQAILRASGIILSILLIKKPAKTTALTFARAYAIIGLILSTVSLSPLSLKEFSYSEVGNIVGSLPWLIYCYTSKRMMNTYDPMRSKNWWRHFA